MPDEPVRTCPGCGRPLSSDQSSCLHCGGVFRLPASTSAKRHLFYLRLTLMASAVVVAGAAIFEYYYYKQYWTSEISRINALPDSTPTMTWAARKALKNLDAYMWLQWGLAVLLWVMASRAKRAPVAAAIGAWMIYAAGSAYIFLQAFTVFTWPVGFRVTGVGLGLLGAAILSVCFRVELREQRPS